MARVVTLKDRLKQIRRKFKRVSKERFFYNDKRELGRRYLRIRCWFLIHSEESGYSIFPIDFKRGAMLAVEQWARLFKHRLRIASPAPTPGYYEPLFLVFTQLVLTAINNRGGAQWKFKALIGWTGIVDKIAKERATREFAFGDSRQTKNTHSRSARNKTAKKRDADARNTRRRRQRNSPR